MRTYKILPEDRDWLEKRIAYLGKKIKDLGPEFHEVLNQSSETWHDNAPFDAVRDKQSLIYSEYSHLKHILLNSEPVIQDNSSQVISIGSTVVLQKGEQTKSYFIAGDWSYQAGKTNRHGALVVSCQSPIAQALIGRKIGETTKFGVINSF